MSSSSLFSTFSHSNTPCCGAVAQPLPRLLARLRDVDDPRSARNALGLSLSEMGRALGDAHPNGHGQRPFHRSALSHWEHGDYPMTDDTREAYRRVITQAIEQASAGRVTVSIHFGSRRWRITHFARCGCGRLFKIDRASLKNCPRCRRRRTGG